MYGLDHGLGEEMQEVSLIIYMAESSEISNDLSDISQISIIVYKNIKKWIQP